MEHANNLLKECIKRCNKRILLEAKNVDNSRQTRSRIDKLHPLATLDVPRTQKYDYSCKMCKFETMRRHHMKIHLKSDQHVEKELDWILKPSSNNPSEAYSLHENSQSLLGPRRKNMPVAETSVKGLEKIKTQPSLIDYKNWPRLQVRM